MQLRDLGKLQLSDPVSQHLPWFALGAADGDTEPVDITVEMLLTHSAGLPREAADFPYWSPPHYEFPTRDQMRQLLSGQQSLYPAARYLQYSNLGLSVAGEIVAALSGEPYAEYVQRHILEPLGLSDTRPFFPTRKSRSG